MMMMMMVMVMMMIIDLCHNNDHGDDHLNLNSGAEKEDKGIGNVE